jgi:hypothetical protein
VLPFRISSIQANAAVINLSVNSATGCVYTLQGSDTSQTYWDELSSQPGNGGVLGFTAALGSSSIYLYRVAAIPAANLTLFPSGPRLSSGPISLADAFALNPYHVDISPVSTGTGPYNVQFSGSLPVGMQETIISNQTANALCRVSSAGTGLVADQRVQFTVSVTDAKNAMVSRAYDLRVIAPPPAILSSNLILKTGATTNAALVGTNGTAPVRWSLASSDLPGGISFSTNGTFSGTPTADASERYETGLYTNVVLLTDSCTDRITGLPHPRITAATISTLVRLSFELNLVAGRADGPVFGGICTGCHGPYFAPDFTSGTALSVIYVSAGSGNQCDSSWYYIYPGNTGASLIYLKLTTPPCGNQMPYGGPYFDDVQIGRLARWINELTNSDTD